MPSARFEPAIPAIKRLQTCTLDSTDTGMAEYGSRLSLFAEVEEVQKGCALASSLDLLRTLQ